MRIPEPNGWNEFLKQTEVPLDTNALREHFAGKSVLATGAGGFIGSAVAEALSVFGARRVVLLEADEHRLYEVHRKLVAKSGAGTEIKPVLGSVCDARLLAEVFEAVRPEFLFHAAAFKHVPLTQENPFAVIENNALGTATLVEVAERFGVEQFLLVSTDKAAAPRSWMGASKRIAELAVLARASESFVPQAMRLGNVLDSPGSAAPLFREQIAAGGPVTVTHPEARRYFLTIQQARGYLLSALAQPRARGLLVPEMAEASVVDLAKFLIGGRDVAIRFTQLRPGEKLEERLIAETESFLGNSVGGSRLVDTPVPSNEELARGLAELRAAVYSRDLTKLRNAVRELVPEYTDETLRPKTAGKVEATGT